MLKRRIMSLVSCILMVTLLTITSLAQHSDNFSEEMLRIHELMEENAEESRVTEYLMDASQKATTLAKDIPSVAAERLVLTEEVVIVTEPAEESVKETNASAKTEPTEVTEETEKATEATEPTEAETVPEETEAEEEEVHYYRSGDLAPKGELTFENIPVEDYEWDGDVINSYVGTVKGPSGKETFYNLPMGGVIDIMESLGYTGEYWVREDGAKMFGDFIMVAAELGSRPKGTIIKTSLGWAVVCDTGGFTKWNPTQLDIATAW